MGQDFNCGCRLSGSLFMCDRHAVEFIMELESNETQTSKDDMQN